MISPRNGRLARRSLHQRQATCAVITKKNFLCRRAAGAGRLVRIRRWRAAAATLSNFTGTRTDKAFTPRASVNFKPNPNNNIYLSYSRGFKGGGFDPRGNCHQRAANTPTTPPTASKSIDFMAFDPEKVDSYELGWKASLSTAGCSSRRQSSTLNIKDVQVPGSEACTTRGRHVAVTGFCGITTNAGKARMRGVEVEANARLAQ